LLTGLFDDVFVTHDFSSLPTDPALNSATNCDLIPSNKYGEN
jgi:hypothetical protein